MLTNTDCTVYRYQESGYERLYIPDCFWQDSHNVKITTGAFIQVDETLIYIPESHSKLAPRTPQKDLIVRGNCPYVFDNASDATISASLKALNYRYDVVIVTSIAYKQYGAALRHIKVVAE